MNGSKLRAFRTIRGVTAAAIARETERSRSRISAIESSDDVSPAVAERYLNAVLKLKGAPYRARVTVDFETEPNDYFNARQELRELLS